MASKIKVDEITTVSETGNLVIPGGVALDGSQATTAWKIPKGTDGERPAATGGELRYNTTVNRLEFYNGTEWFQMGPPPFDLYDDAYFDAFIGFMAGQKTSWASSGTNYQYQTDASDTYISDAQSDMYDGGNYTQIRVNGNASGDIGYNSNSGTYSQIKYGQLGYSWPLVSIAVAPTGVSKTYGYSRSGNLGADGGGGSVGSITVYNNATVQGFNPVSAWLVNKAWNQNSDPGVMHLYCTVGHPNWQSTITNGFVTTDFSTSSNSDYSQYQSTSTSCFQMTVLVSNGQTVGAMTQGQAQTFISNFLADAKTHFGY
tara:strand:- start:1211 stop:2155 length:945 start_codon:yes stop_codon:yes gene_type:complete